MQIVYHAQSLADARSACSKLADAGIASHIADQELWEVAGKRPQADVIRVLVDNRRLDAARRALRGWVHTATRPFGSESAGHAARDLT